MRRPAAWHSIVRPAQSPLGVHAHLRVSKHSPYVLKFPIQSATSSLHFKNLCAWGDDRNVIGQQYTIQGHYAGFDNQQVMG